MRNLNIKQDVAAFVAGDTASDLVEYALLLVFIALAGAAAFLSMGSNTNVLWSVANSRLAAANDAS